MLSFIIFAATLEVVIPHLLKPVATYTFGENDDKFTIKSNEIKAKEQLTEGTYKLKVKVTDSKNKEKTSDEVTITVSAQ